MVRNILPVVVLLIVVGMPGVNRAQDVGNGKQIDNILKLLKTHENAKVRAGAAYTLGLLGAKAEICLADLVLACGDKSEEVAKAAKEAIRRIASGSRPDVVPKVAVGEKTGSGTYKVDTLKVNPNGDEN